MQCGDILAVYRSGASPSAFVPMCLSDSVRSEQGDTLWDSELARCAWQRWSPSEGQRLAQGTRQLIANGKECRPQTVHLSLPLRVKAWTTGDREGNGQNRPPSGSSPSSWEAGTHPLFSAVTGVTGTLLRRQCLSCSPSQLFQMSGGGASGRIECGSGWLMGYKLGIQEKASFWASCIS